MFVFINEYNQVTFSWNSFSNLLIFFLFSLSNNEAFTASSQEEFKKILNSSCFAKKVIYLS